MKISASTESSFEILVCDAEERSDWDEFVQLFPEATVCHLFHWRSIIQEAYGHRPIYLMAKGDTRVRGVLPLFLVKSRIFGKSLTSMPFLDYGGACADSLDVMRTLLTRAMGLLNEVGADYLEIRQCAPVGKNVAARLDKVSMILNLSPGVQALWQALPAKVRNQVRKAEKAGLRVGFGGEEFVEEFYPVFAANMRDLGSPVHHIGFFSQMFRCFGRHAELAIIRDGNRAVGGLVALFFKDTVVIPWASCLREYFSKCPNNLLYWEAIKRASERGCKQFDFGRSSVDSGTYHFKRQWGAKPLQIYWQTLTSTGEARSLSAAENSKFQIASEVWKRLPVSFTTLIGPRVRKYITN
jgi:FemAB-related protein (PEP-CTERM system-associated)